MPPSMRKQTRVEKKRKYRDIERAKAREHAVTLLENTSLSPKEIMAETGVGHTTFYLLKRFIKTGDEQRLSELLKPSENRAGRPRVLRAEEEEMISKRMIFAARRGFAMSVENIKYIMRAVASDGRGRIPEGYPSNDVIRSFRARHREITYRKTENKESAKIRGETFEHVKTYEDVFLAVDRDFPASKNVMQKWFHPLSKANVDLYGSELYKFNEPDWFPGDGFVVCTENGSMEMNVMPLFIEHLDRFVRKAVPSSKEYLLCLDGHASRKGVEWLYACLEKNCQAVQSPANTTQVLQPCDQYINSVFNTTVRKTRDRFCSLGSSEITSVRAKLMSAVRALHQISVTNIKDSFSKTGLWPMNFDFAGRFKTTADVHKDHVNALKANHTERVAFPLKTLKRIDDQTTTEEIMNIMRKNIGPSRKLQAVQLVLKRSETVNDVLMSIGPGTGRKRSSTKGYCGGKRKCTRGESQDGTECEEGDSTSKNGILCTGTPAIYLTHAETIKERESKIREAKEAKAEKNMLAQERKRIKQLQSVEKKKKRQERERKKLERAENRKAGEEKRKRKDLGKPRGTSKNNPRKVTNENSFVLLNNCGVERTSLAVLAEAAVEARDGRNIP